MDNEVEFRKRFAEIVDPVIPQINSYDGKITLKELYERKKSRLGLSDTKIQQLLGMDRQTLMPIIEGRAKRISYICMLKLACFLGVSMENLARIHASLMSEDDVHELQTAREASFITEYFDVSKLTKMGFFKRNSTACDMAERLKRFFGCDKLSGCLLDADAAFSSTKRNSSELMRNFWLKSAQVQFTEIGCPYSYDRVKLLEIAPRIKPYTQYTTNGLVTVIRALYRCGVFVIFQPRCEGLQVRGATMIVNGRPCVVLSDHNKRYPTLWFALMHELFHVLYDIDAISMSAYHISDGIGDLMLYNEKKADRFASEYFLTEEKYRYASSYIDSNMLIKRMAEKWSVHPSFIYARHCYYNDSEWARYSRYIPDMNDAVKNLNMSPFTEESLKETAAKIKEIIYNV